MIAISSLDNPRYKTAKRWVTQPTTQKSDCIAIVDTPHPIAYVLEHHKHSIDRVFIHASAPPDNLSIFTSLDCPCYSLSPALFNSLTTPSHQGGAILVVQAPEAPLFIPDHYSSLMICDGIQHAHNLGTIIRSASAFGVEGILITDQTVYPYHRDAIRASTGYAFSIPVWRLTPTILQQLCDASFPFFAADVHASQPIHSLKYSSKKVVIFGSEAHGICCPDLDSIRDHIQSFYIPMADHVESLNVGISAGISLFYLQHMVK